MNNYTLGMHQRKAFDSIVGYRGRRCQYISACGTGKTLVGKELIDFAFTSHEGIAIVFIPSLALMAQTHQSYEKWGIAPDIKPIFVCSDKDIGKKYLLSTTDLDVIIQELSSHTKKKVIVFCTYHSSILLAQALKKTKQIPLLAIYDEAHRTASNEGNTFNYTLLDKNLQIRKRVFMTATPKHSSIGRNDAPSFSMENKLLYGPVVENYTLRQAIEDGVIAPYKVIISVISEPLAESIGDKSSKLENASIKQSAKMYALATAIQKYKIKKAIVFAERIQKSKRYIAGLNKLLPNRKSVHIDSSHGNEFVLDTLKKLRDGKISIVGNATLLSEGIDVPSVEMAALMEKTNSVQNIIQRIGRPTRIDPDNPYKVGYIFLPLFLSNENDSVEYAAQKEGFGEILRVLNTLYENDEYFKQVIEEERPGERGSGNGGFSDIISFDFDGDFTADIAKVINQVKVSIASHIRPVWDINIERYIEFKRRKGREPRKSDTFKDIDLFSWCTIQRHLRKHGLLSDERIIRLDHANFKWGGNEENWERIFSFLQKFVGEFSRFPKNTETYEGEKLGSWTSTQKIKQKKGSLSTERLRKLESLGVSWIQSLWIGSLADYAKYMSARDWQGYIPAHTLKTKTAVTLWEEEQIDAYHKGLLDKDKIQTLESAGIIWVLPDEEWMRLFYLYNAYVEKYTRVRGENCIIGGENIGHWASEQRIKKANGELSPESVKYLDRIGFRWELSEEENDSLVSAL